MCVQGLKLKQVRHLCYQQLKNMTDNDIIKAISNPEPAPPPPALDSSNSSNSETKTTAAVKEKTEWVQVGDLGTKIIPGDEEEMDHLKKTSAEDQHKSMLEEAVQMVLDVSDVSDETSPPPQGSLLMSDRKVSGEDQERRRKDSLHSDRKRAGRAESNKEGGAKVLLGDEVDCVDVEKVESLCSPHEVMEGQDQEEMQQTAQSWASDETGTGPDQTGTGPDQTGTGPDQTGTGPGQLDLSLRQSTAEEAAELLEMKLRRRALESELRRRSREKEKQRDIELERAQVKMAEEEVLRQRAQGIKIRIPARGSEDEDAITLHPRDEEEEIVKGGRGEEEEEEEEGGSASMEDGELLEERLRRRALQSMWARRKSKGDS